MRLRESVICPRWLWVPVAMVLACFATLGRADTPVANLNSTAAFATASSASDTLEVNSGSAQIKATSATKVQGDANSMIVVIETPGSGNAVQVATVTNRAGDSLYAVSGIFVGGAGGSGGGGPPPTWGAKYNKGTARIVLKLSSSQIKFGPKGATLSVSVAGADDNTTYPIALDIKAGSTGDVGFQSSPVNVRGSETKTIDLEGKTLGTLTIEGKCNGLDDGTVDGEVVINVTFSVAVIKTGFTVPATIKDIKTIVTATVVPKTSTESVSIAPAGATNEIAISPPLSDPAFGQIAFWVRGAAGTPANRPNGDVKVQAKAPDGTVLAEVPAIVIIPAATGTPHPQPNAVVTPYNDALDGTTVPAFSVPAGQVLLATIYCHTLTVPVVDQFGTALDAMYNSVPVTEAGVPINVSVSNGTYPDCVGLTQTSTLAAKGSPQATAWKLPATPKAPIMPPNGKIGVGRAVEVGGIKLNPGAEFRNAKWTTGGGGAVTVQIIWPN